MISRWEGSMQPTYTGSRHRICTALLVLTVGVLANVGCRDSGVDAAKELRAAFEEALAVLDRNSGEWQETLRDLEARLAKTAQRAAADVQRITASAIAASREAVHCEADFIGRQVKNSLQDTLDRLLGKTPPIRPPVVCLVGPRDYVERRTGEEKDPVVHLSGWGFAAQPRKPTVSLVESGGAKRDESKSIAVLTDYHLAINTGPNGAVFDAKDDFLEVAWPGTMVKSVIPIVRDLPRPDIRLFGKKSDVDHQPQVGAPVDDGLYLVGGGCTPSNSELLLLRDSYPAGREWRCRSREHLVPTTATVTAFAFGVAKSFLQEVKVEESITSVAKGDQSHSVSVLPGYTLIGGGCQIIGRNYPSEENTFNRSTFLVASHPLARDWTCTARQHSVSATMNLRAYAIGIRTDSLEVVVTSKTSEKEAHPHVAAPVAEGATLVGGGCEVVSGGNANMLVSTTSAGDNAWFCQSKDHGVSDPGTVTAYAIGVRRLRK